MKKVYYKGEAYNYKVIFNLTNSRQYLLYKNDVVARLIDEGELDQKPFLSLIRGVSDSDSFQITPAF